jgi:hypothetical protein
MHTTSSIKIILTSLGAVGYGVKVSAADRDAFSFAIDQLKEIIPVPFRTYDPANKNWVITDGYGLDEWIDKLRGAYDVAVGDSDSKHEQRASQPPPQSIASPFQTLYLLPNAPPEVVKAAYKALAKIHHPDARGSSERMIEINRAFEVITQKH